MRTVDLFAGCGGMSLGLMAAEFDVVAAFELWDKAADCYESNLGHKVVRYDLSDSAGAADIISGYSPDVIVGGPPCQDFSQAGRRLEGSRASLTRSFAEIVARVMSKYFIMENVARAQSSESYTEARNILKGAGYGLTEVTLDASLCGVPQRRLRFFCIGGFGEKDGFVSGIMAERLADKPMSLRDYVGDSFGLEHYYRHPRNYNRRAVFSIDEPSPTIRGVNRPIPAGYSGHKNDSSPVTDSLRPLTTEERARVQTFPEGYRWGANKTDTEQMIGNAVPVRLAAFVGAALRDFAAQ